MLDGFEDLYDCEDYAGDMDLDDLEDFDDLEELWGKAWDSWNEDCEDDTPY